MDTEMSKTRLSRFEYGLILFVFCICLTGALLLPVDQCPDEDGRLLLTEWIVKTGTLPTGDEAEVMIPEWGYSYALYPNLSAIIGALFERIAVCFTGFPRILLAASRMSSVLSVTFCCYFCLCLGHRLFERKSSAVLFAVLVCFLPQVMFLGMYQNNDALSLCAVSMMSYYLAEGYDCRWAVRSCVGLAFGISLGLLSYYSVYGWILMCAVFCVLAVLTSPEIHDKGRLICKRAALIAGVCLVLAGWFFLRNALLHHGDFLGIVSEQRSRAHMQEQGYFLSPYICYRAEGMSPLQFLHFKDHEWIWMSAESFIGVFGYMLFHLPKVQYGIYYALFLYAAILFLAVLLREKITIGTSFCSL